MRAVVHRAAGAASLLLALLLAACGGGDSKQAVVTPPPATPSQHPPAPPGANFNVLPCLQQLVGPGRTVASLVVPDTLTIDLSQPAGFPNGRRLEDPVVDLTLAVLFLDLTKEPVTRFANLPLDPTTNDVPLRPNFPYLGLAQGNPPLGPVAQSGFNFRTDPDSAYVRVDRMGMPAVATVLISTETKSQYNDSNPLDDDQLKYYPDITDTLKGLTDALSDDCKAAGLHMCATPN